MGAVGGLVGEGLGVEEGGSWDTPRLLEAWKKDECKEESSESPSCPLVRDWELPLSGWLISDKLSSLLLFLFLLRKLVMICDKVGLLYGSVSCVGCVGLEDRSSLGMSRSGSQLMLAGLRGCV